MKDTGYSMLDSGFNPISDTQSPGTGGVPSVPENNEKAVRVFPTAS
jgi:hypothetical protein